LKYETNLGGYRRAYRELLRAAAFNSLANDNDARACDKQSSARLPFPFLRANRRLFGLQPSD
jgi:hypothetical protein